MSSVDVIVPCYLYGHFLRECVESVLGQSGSAVRVLIIDDASPDNTAEIAADLVRSDARVALLRHSTNQGHIATYNEGIEWVSADYMLLLSADDYLLPGALNRSTRLMDKHPYVGFTFGKAIEFFDDGKSLPPQPETFKQEEDAECILAGPEFIELTGPRDIVFTPTAVVRTTLQKQIGGYRHDLPHTGDLEMWLRLAAHASVGMFRGYQAVYRRHSINMSRTYMGKTWLPDLQQRNAALDVFFGSHSHVLQGRGNLRRRIMRSLALDAIDHGSKAFNAGNSHACEQYADFALRVYPRATRSWPWTRLALKRAVGLRSWQLLNAVVKGAGR